MFFLPQYVVKPMAEWMEAQPCAQRLRMFVSSVRPRTKSEHALISSGLGVRCQTLRCHVVHIAGAVAAVGAVWYSGWVIVS